MRRAIALLLVAAAGCTKQPAPATKAQAPTKIKLADDSADRLSLATVARGAAITSRTGELFLAASALKTIDGDPASFWMTPPEDLPQTMTIALAAPSRIERVGIRTDRAYPANRLQFDVSSDGKTFSPLTTVTSSKTEDAQWFSVPPTAASQVRVTVIDAAGHARNVRLKSILIGGTESQPPKSADVSGCWSTNGDAARFERNGARVVGAAALGRQAMQLEGGFDGRIYRFNWMRGSEFGYLLLSTTPDAQSFSAIEWHEDVIPLFYGDSWFGTRTRCGEPLPLDSDTRDKFLHRAGRFSLFGLRFADDGRLDSTASRDTLQWLAQLNKTIDLQLIAHEFRRSDANANRAYAERETQTLRDELQRAGADLRRISFIARGSDAPRERAESDAMRAMYSVVDVEIRR